MDAVFKPGTQAIASPPWRSALLINPAAELLPRMTSEELRALSEDIKQHGQRQPIAIIENLALQREIADLKTKRQPVSEASRCAICHEKKPAVLRPVFICDSCVDIHEVREATPPVDDGLDTPASLRRDKQTETTP